MSLWSTGINETSGGFLASTKSPLLISAGVIFCHYGTGDDANPGTDRDFPKKTIAAAYAAAAANGCIVLLDGHAETVSSALTLAKAGLTICGGGFSGGVPTCSLQQAGSGYYIFDITAAGVTIDGVKFLPSAAAASSSYINLQANELKIRNCRFELNANNSLGAGLYINTGTPSDILVQNTVFVSTGTSAATAANSGIIGNVATTNLKLIDVTFDGGAYGFTGAGIGYTADITRLRGEGVMLLRGADASFTAGTTGYFNISLGSTGNARVTWSGGAA